MLLLQITKKKIWQDYINTTKEKIQPINTKNKNLIIPQNKELVKYSNKLKIQLAKSYTAIERVEELQRKNTHLKYENEELKKENHKLKNYIVEQVKFANNQTNNDEKLLFKPSNQRYTKRENVNSELKRILKKHFNITDISTHSLRHTFGTRCIESGMTPVVVQKLMGHKDVGVTLK